MSEAEDDPSKDPALFYACSSGDWAEVERLMDQGRGLAFCKVDGSTVLHCAVRKKAPAGVLERLLSLGADPNTPSLSLRSTPLHECVRANAAPESLRLLVRAGGDVQRTSHDGVTALMWAGDQNASVELLQALLEAGADVQQKDARGWTALHWAVRANAAPGLVKRLLEHGAEPNALDIEGRFSPTLLAVEMKVSFPLLRTLLAGGGAVDDRLEDCLVRSSWSQKKQLLAHLRRVRFMLVFVTPRAIAGRSRSSLRLLPPDVARGVSRMLSFQED